MTIVYQRASDAVVMFGKESDPSHTYVSVESKDNDEPLSFVLAFQKDGDAVQLTAESVPDRKAVLEGKAAANLEETQAVLDVLVKESPNGIKPIRVKQKLGVSLNTAKTYLNALVDRGTAKLVDGKDVGQRGTLYLPA